MHPHSLVFSTHGRLLREEPARILVAEDDEELRSLLALILVQDGYQVDQAADGDEFVEALARLCDDGRQANYSLIVTDLHMPGYSGLDVLLASRCLRAYAPVIVLSAYLDDGTRRLASFLGARVLLEKPVDLDDFRMTVLNLLAHSDLGSGVRVARTS